MNELRFFNLYAEIRQTKNLLPHWQQQGSVYLITFRLADSVPSNLRAQWENERAIWLRLHPEPWTREIEHKYHQRFSDEIERWLDAGYGSCVLRRRDCATLVYEAIRYFDGDRLSLVSCVVMPNHVHVLFVQNSEYPLEQLTRSWKTFTARRINSLLCCSGALWQRDYFDRIVRHEQHFANCVRYIRRNPEKAGLRDEEYVLYESDLAKQTE